jgi:hypothetical protein
MWGTVVASLAILTTEHRLSCLRHETGVVARRRGTELREVEIMRWAGCLSDGFVGVLFLTHREPNQQKRVSPFADAQERSD